MMGLVIESAEGLILVGGPYFVIRASKRIPE